jgi:hypothetical protein
MGRHPVERAVSYYYQRCYGSRDCVGYQRRINDLTVEELRFVALSERQGKLAADNRTFVILDEGMSEAGCRALADEKHTTGRIIGTGTSNGGGGGLTDLSLPPPLSRDAEDRAIEQNLPRCAVGILEQWAETKRVLRHWFPWLDFSRETHRRKMHVYSGKETVDSLRPAIRHVLEEVNRCDLRLYARMRELFEKQLAVVNAQAFGAGAA